jgi:alkylation response protein AidB-like acyl-CoA dehydrogenase
VARRFFGPANAVLAWGAGAAGKAVAVPGGYRINGKWSFASGSRPATLLGAHCKVFEADGTTPRLRPDGRQLERTALLERGKAVIKDDWRVMGLRGTGSDTYTVNDLFVAENETLDRESVQDVREKGPLFKFPGIQCYAAVFAGVMIGIARGAIDDLIGLTQTKTPRGAPSPMRDNPVVHNEIAMLEGRWRAARHYHHNTLEALWRRAAGGEPITLDDRIDGRLSSTYALNQCADIVVSAYRLAGQHAIFDNNPFEQRLRDAMTASQQVQARPSHYVTVGRYLVGLPPDTMLFL